MSSFLAIINDSRERLPTRFTADARRLLRIFEKRRFSKVFPSEISLFLADRAGMKDFNRRFKHSSRDTDVLAFDTGDIVVSVFAAKRQAKEMEHSLRDELLHLFAHALLHLAGHDDDTTAKRGEMDREAVELRTLLEAPARRRSR